MFVASQYRNNRKLFVTNLNFDTDEYALMRHFQYVGKVVSVQIIRYNSGDSKGYGFVEMKDNRTAQNAINILYNSLLDGRYIRIEFARSHSTTRSISRSTSNQPNQIDGYTDPIIIQQSSSSSSQIPLQAPNPQSMKCLKVSKFDFSMTQEQVRQLFAKIGEVDDVKIIIEDQNRVGYVKMKYEEDAQKTVDEYDGFALNRSHIEVKQVTSEAIIPKPEINTNQNTNSSSRKPRPPKIHAHLTRNRIKLSNLPLDTTEDELKQEFAIYDPSGYVITTDNSGQQTDIGFIQFYNEKDQQRAFKGKPSLILRGRTVTVTAPRK
ncbi:MAG: hypothetical protein EZS28_010272 [Streblomastix strix]|uniref:RRM domain-containing protein n=1 Tax=Streblomastix strix TaxID=222440 RepID=A0A5J4WH18_9EUKA|nr:MAG: hypothetical protein EZS28_010272 [Streblomastix strix]